METNSRIVTFTAKEVKEVSKEKLRNMDRFGYKAGVGGSIQYDADRGQTLAIEKVKALLAGLNLNSEEDNLLRDKPRQHYINILCHGRVDPSMDQWKEWNKNFKLAVEHLENMRLVPENVSDLEQVVYFQLGGILYSLLDMLSTEETGEKRIDGWNAVSCGKSEWKGLCNKLRNGNKIRPSIFYPPSDAKVCMEKHERAKSIKKDSTSGIFCFLLGENHRFFTGSYWLYSGCKKHENHQLTGKGKAVLCFKNDKLDFWWEFEGYQVIDERSKKRSETEERTGKEKRATGEVKDSGRLEKKHAVGELVPHNITDIFTTLSENFELVLSEAMGMYVNKGVLDYLKSASQCCHTRVVLLKMVDFNVGCKIYYVNKKGIELWGFNSKADYVGKRDPDVFTQAYDPSGCESCDPFPSPIEIEGAFEGAPHILGETYMFGDNHISSCVDDFVCVNNNVTNIRHILGETYILSDHDAIIKGFCVVYDHVCVNNDIMTVKVLKFCFNWNFLRVMCVVVNM
jgi:hypothetical protein